LLDSIEYATLYNVLCLMFLVTYHYWQDLDLSGFKILKGLAKLHALNEKLLFDYAPF